MRKLLTTAVLAFFTLTSFAQFSGSGSGTQSDPYKIFYADQLSQMRNFTNQSGVVFKLMNDLDISTWLTENYPGQGWQPIGSSSTPFKGVFDGNGKTITGFSITRTSTDYVGLFAVVEGATIKNLTLKGDIKGKAYVGSVFGSGSATVTNYTFEGTVTGTGNYTGGVGGSQGATSSTLTVNATVKGASYTGGVYGSGAGLASASFTGQVTGTSYVGGLEGQGSGTLTSCIVNAPVYGTSTYIGGLVGYVSNSLTASNCKHTGSVSSKQYTGGLVGYATANITLNNSTQRGNVTGTTTQTGGLIGYSENSAVTLTSCYAEGNITGTTSVGGICGQIQNPGSSSISACSFWGNISGKSQMGGVVGSITITNATTTPDYTITTKAGYKSPTYPASTSTYLYSCCGCFYNNGAPSFAKRLSGSTSSHNYYHHYVYTSSIAYIDKWSKSNGTVYAYNGSDYITNYGAVKSVYNNILDTNTNLNISNCSAVGNINGTGTHIGGIVGQDVSSHIALSESKTVYYYAGDGINSVTTSLTLNSYSIRTSNITESYFSGNLTGTDYIGGIAGTKQGGCINKCYASGSISGGQYVGGIAGSLSKEYLNTNENSLNANVSICTSITGTSNVGRIYGATDGNFSVAALGTTSENRSVASTQMVVNGVTQTLNDDLQNGTAVGISQLRYKANYVAWGWNFNTNWTIQDTETFPYKTWQAAPPTITGNLISGDTSISGKSTDGGTVYIK